MSETVMFKEKPSYCPPFTPMCDVIGEGECGGMSIEHFVVDEEQAKKQRFYSHFSFTYGDYYDFKAGRYVRLMEDGKTYMLMSDTPMERRTNLDFVRFANCDVLIGGLGLGMIVVPLLTSKVVKSLTIIEKDERVASLVWPYITRLDTTLDDLTLIMGDVNEWRPEKGVKYDTIYFDIWPEVCGDYYEEMKFLHRSWAHRLERRNGTAFMTSWRKKDFADQRW